MSKYWVKPVTILIIVNLFFTPTALAFYEGVDFFTSIGSLVRSDAISAFFSGPSYDPDKNQLATVGRTALVAPYNPAILFTSLVSDYQVFNVVVTAYSSSYDETDSTPFVTAAGTRTRDGVIAANFLSFGDKVKIPELFGDKVFVVEDRMNRRFSDRLDVWFPTKWQAKRFGKHNAQIIVFEKS